LRTGEDQELDLSPVAQAGPAVRGYARLLTEQDRRFAVIYAEDDSELVRLEATRQDFVANVSHELKNPVGAMGLMAEALLASVDDPDTVYGFGEKIFAEAQRLGQMVRELIELSRLQGAEALPNLVPVDIDSVVADAIARNQLCADSANIVVSADPPSGFKVLGEHTLLVTALANLVSNAIAYSPPGSAVSVSARRCGDNVEIAVSDRGIGIAEADQQRIFERFFRVDKARSRAAGGSTGLGLAIVKNVAANHNGTVRVWSRAGIGSTFTLSIPACLDTAGMSDQPEKEMVGVR
jgi:two-component system sensor histidine kinase SenX3